MDGAERPDSSIYAAHMTGIEPELWAERPRDAIAFYQAAFGATVLLQVGEDDDIVARLAAGEARFWVSTASVDRPAPSRTHAATGRTLLVVDDPDAVHADACAAGATSLAPVAEEHGWRLGRIVDPAGHEWEVGRPADGGA